MNLEEVALIIHCEITVHGSGALCTHHQDYYIKIVDAITSTSHVSVWCRFKSVNICPRWESTSLCHGQISPNLAMT